MKPRFEPLTSTSGLAIIDPIESRRFSLLTPEVVSESPADPADFHFPVTSACSIQTHEITLPYTILAYVRETDGTMITGAEPPADISLPKDEYLIELTSPVKIYLKVESSLNIEGDTDTLRFSFADETTLTVGARSRHKSPAGTITVSDDPVEIMQAISALSSSLKTTSPERSFPTLRGHPPRIERGDELHIPDKFSRPETGISIEVPPEYGKLYPIAPLAFYLGAELIPSNVPKLTTDTGFEYRLDSYRGFEAAIEQAFKQIFLLDCVIRTEGYYPVKLAEREAVEHRLNFDLAELYNRPLAERVETFLEVPYSTIEDTVPTWHRTTFVRPNAENVELLPYIVNDLSIIRTPSQKTVEESDQAEDLWEEINDFQRGSPRKADAVFRSTTESESTMFTRTGRTRSDTVSPRDYVSIPDTDSLEQAWAGRGIPTSGTKLLPAAYNHERTIPDDDVIDVTVICNDSRMQREWNTLSDIYGGRKDIPFKISFEFATSKADLRKLLEAPTDFLHYIGHIDDRGFDCIDGFLDAKSIDNVGMKAFLLNACNSYEQGTSLIEAGASAGIVSLSEVGNQGAIEIGKNLATLFHQGYSVGVGLGLIQEYTAIGSRYIGLGDVGLMLTQSEDSHLLYYEIEECESEDFDVTIYSYPNRICPIGMIMTFWLSEIEEYYFSPGNISTVKTSKSEFKDLLSGEDLPLIVEGQLVWSSEWLSNGD